MLNINSVFVCLFVVVVCSSVRSFVRSTGGGEARPGQRGVQGTNQAVQVDGEHQGGRK